MKKWMIVIVVLILMILAVFSAGCAVSVPDAASIGNTVVVKPLNYGNGVYYFPVVQAKFGNSLSAFIKNHPELQLVSMAPDDYVSYGYTTGYFVVFSEK